MTDPSNKISASRIFIIEDEPTIAFDLQDLLEDSGFHVVGVASSLEKAIEGIQSIAMDVAIIDANLNGISSGPAAVALKARAVPFVVLSGYSLKQQEDAFPGGLFLQKPCRPDRLIRALEELLVLPKT